jgi:hypothetical protein
MFPTSNWTRWSPGRGPDRRRVLCRQANGPTPARPSYVVQTGSYYFLATDRDTGEVTLFASGAPSPAPAADELDGEVPLDDVIVALEILVDRGDLPAPVDCPAEDRLA